MDIYFGKKKLFSVKTASEKAEEKRKEEERKRNEARYIQISNNTVALLAHALDKRRNKSMTLPIKSIDTIKGNISRRVDEEKETITFTFNPQ